MYSKLYLVVVMNWIWWDVVYWSFLKVTPHGSPIPIVLLVLLVGGWQLIDWYLHWCQQSEEEQGYENQEQEYQNAGKEVWSHPELDLWSLWVSLQVFCWFSIAVITVNCAHNLVGKSKGSSKWKSGFLLKFHF